MESIRHHRSPIRGHGRPAARWTGALLAALLATGALAQTGASPAPGTAAQPTAGSADLRYVGADTRIGVGVDHDGYLYGDIRQVLSEGLDYSLIGEASATRRNAGLRATYNWVGLRDGRVAPDATVYRLFGAVDHRVDSGTKFTLGGGLEREAGFLTVYGSGTEATRRLIDSRTSTASRQQTGAEADGRPYVDTITTTTVFSTFERPYDWGVGLRAGRFFAEPLLRLTAGVDHEWGRESSRQLTFSLEATKHFLASPHSLSLRVEHLTRNGRFETRGDDTRGLFVYRYEFGGGGRPVDPAAGRMHDGQGWRPAVLTRTVEVTAPPAPAPAVPPQAAAPASPPPAPAASAPTRRVETRIVKTTASASSDAFFDFDRAALRPEARAELDRVAEVLKTAGFTGNVRITGHTCDIGTDAYNLGLSQRRAAAVRDYLVANGTLRADQVIVEGKGKREPRFQNTPADRPKNRRVDIEFVRYVEKPEQVVVEVPAPVTAPAPAAAPAAPAAAPAPAPAPAVTWRTEVVDAEPAWVRQALRATPTHKQSIDTYRVVSSRTSTATDRQYIARPPVARDDAATVRSGQSVTVQVLGNDTDPDGGTLSLVSVTTPSRGTAAVSGSAVVYTAPADFVGTATFDYTIGNPSNLRATARVTVTVTAPPAAPPVARDDTATVVAGQTVSIPVLANDSDPANLRLSIDAVTPPTRGTATIRGDAIAYAAPADFAGTATFGYTIVNTAGERASARVTVTVTPAPAPADPVARDDSATVQQGQSVRIAVLANDTDPGGLRLSLLSVAAPGQGTATIDGDAVVYTAPASFAGTVRFAYTIANSEGRRATAQISVTVTERPAVPPQAPIARDDYFLVPGDRPFVLDVLANDSDPQGEPIRIVSVTALTIDVGRIEISAAGDRIVFTPYEPFGNTSFRYTIRNRSGLTATARVILDDPIMMRRPAPVEGPR